MGNWLYTTCRYLGRAITGYILPAGPTPKVEVASTPTYVDRVATDCARSQASAQPFPAVGAGEAMARFEEDFLAQAQAGDLLLLKCHMPHSVVRRERFEPQTSSPKSEHRHLNLRPERLGVRVYCGRRSACSRSPNTTTWRSLCPTRPTHESCV